MNVPLAVRIPRQHKRLLHLEARRHRRSMSAVVRKAIVHYFEDKPRESQSLFRELAAIGKNAKVKSAPQDLSLKYKKYLYRGN